MADAFGGLARTLGVGLAAAAIVCPVCVFGVTSAAAQGGAQGTARAPSSQPVQARSQASDTATVRLHISGMTCGTCPVTARVALRKSPGVYTATVTLGDSLGVIRYDRRRTTAAEIAARLTKATGYGARILEEPAGSRR